MALLDYLMNNDDKVVIIEMNDGDSQESKLTSKSGKIVENSFSTSSSTESAPKITTSTQSPENKGKNIIIHRKYYSSNSLNHLERAILNARKTNSTVV